MRVADALSEQPVTHVAILWHMHQPPYRDPLDGTHVLPWVRLHAIKDYLGMVEILEETPEVRVLAGKDACGTLLITAMREASSIVLQVKDVLLRLQRRICLDDGEQGADSRGRRLGVGGGIQCPGQAVPDIDPDAARRRRCR